MRIEIKFRNSDARRIEHNLRQYYETEQATFEQLAKLAILEISAKQANKEMEEAVRALEEE